MRVRLLNNSNNRACSVWNQRWSDLVQNLVVKILVEGKFNQEVIEKKSVIVVHLVQDL
jgi:peroxiredoxin